MTVKKLTVLCAHDFSEIIIVGHSVAGIDLPYFKRIDECTNRELIWNVHYYAESEKDKMKAALESQGIDFKRIKLISNNEFYNM
ncbi:MAG: hypothetical protein J6C93_02325 [Clostridia bacterium]|nr:hypothetical protein [Clostridia bacterium]